MNRRESYLEIEDYVTYDVAIGLKEAGFDIPCGEYYHVGEGRDSLEATGKDEYDFRNSYCRYRAAAPSIQEAMKWFRKQYHISVEPRLNPIPCESKDGEDSELWYVEVFGFMENYINYSSSEDFNSYEEAVECGFMKALECVKSNNHGK